MARKLSSSHVALGEAIRRARQDEQLSQEALGFSSGLHRNYIGGIERGERNPSYANIRLLATALGLRASVLIARAERIEERR